MIINFLKGKFNAIKICAVFTMVCFLISTLGANLYALPMAENINKKYEDIFNKTNSISNEYGKITSSKDANSDITVINIQDLHCHPQTQKNIAKIIGQITDKYNLKKVYVEGGYGDIDVSWLNSIKNEKIRKQAIEKLLEEGILTGSEYYKLTSNNENVELKGIDEENIHKDNVKRLSWLIAQQDKYKEITKKVTKEIDILENIYVNERNKRFNRIIEDYSINEIDSKTFYKQLLRYIKDINNNPYKYNNITAIRLEDYPNISKFMTLRKVSKDINLKEVTQQLQIVINELKNKLPYGIYTKFLSETENLSNSQKVLELVMLLCDKEGINLEQYKSLNNFLESNYITKTINPIDLVQEERQLISEIRKALSYNNEEYEITFVSDFNKYFQDYLEYKLTDTNWKYFENHFSQFRQMYAKYAMVDRIKEIEQDFVEINKYYNINDQRNNIFVKNLLKDEQINLFSKNKVRQDEEILKNSKEVIIAVTGGFHSSELEQMLASNDVNTIVITPKIYEDIKQANDKYIELIGIQSRVKSQALSYTIASCITDIDKQKLLLSIVKDIIGENTKELEQILGKKIDLSLLEETTQIDKKAKSDIRNILGITIEQVLKNIPQEGMRSAIIPDIDEIMLSLAKQLVDNGIYFSKGMILELENLNGQDIKGIPAEMYARMLPSLQKALLKVAIDEEKADLDITIQEDIQDLYDDTGATESTYIYLEDINNDQKKFISLLEDAIINKKLIVLRVFRNPIDINSLDREQQKKLYSDIRNMFFKIYTDRPLYNFISQPENQEFMQYDIHFFLLEILENSFMHGNKGLDNPIYVYMDLNEQKEINNLRIYNKNSQEDDNFQMRFVRMKLALLGGRHKSNVLMKQNPYRTFETDDNFKGKFYKVSSDIKPSYDEQAAVSLKENHEFISYFSIAAQFKDKNKFLSFLNEIAHIWEELVFRTLPITLTVLPVTSFLPVPAILVLFTISQLLFIKAHGINFKEQIKQRFLPTTILSSPYLLALLFAPGIPAIILSTIIGIVLHKYFNLALKSKLNIFKNIDEKKIPTISQFLSNKKFVDLSNEQEKQILIDILNEYNLSSQEAANLADKINLDDLSQSKYLLEVFEKQIKITDNNKKTIIDALARKFDVSNDVQLEFIKNLLLDNKYFAFDENIAITLVEKLNFYNAEQFDLIKTFLSTKIYNRNLQKDILDIKLLNKIDVNDISQMSLLDLFYNIDDKTLQNLISKFDFSNKNTLQSFLNLILKFNLVQKSGSFELILNNLDLKNRIDFKSLQNIISNTNLIDGITADKLFAKLDFTDKNHLNLVRNIINKKNIELSTIDSLAKYIDINKPNQMSLIKDLIRNFFAVNTRDSKLMFYEKIRKKLETINFNQMDEKDSYVFKMFVDELIVSMQKELVKIQNENIRAKHDKMIVYLLVPQMFNELTKITNILSDNREILFDKAQNNLQELESQIAFFEDMRAEKVTIEDFSKKYNFSLSQQTPNTYIDSNRYSFTKLLSLFSKKVLKHKVSKLSPAYFMEKNEIDTEILKPLLVKFDAYMKLLDENVYILNKFGEVTSFDSQFEDVIKHINLMLDYLYVIDTAEADILRENLNNILENIRNGNTTIEEQKQFSISKNLYEISTINRLVNQIHQKANLDFVLNIKRTSGLSLSKVQNVFVSKDDRTISAYNLSQKSMNPEIKRLLLMLIENPDFSTYDNSQIFIKDNIFLWNGLLGDHSARVLIDFSKDTKNIFVDFSEAERTNESRARIAALRKIFTNFGFYADLYNNNNCLVATVNNDHGLSTDTDICDLAQKAMVALNNAGSLYRPSIPQQVIETASLGIMDIYKKCFFVSSFEKNIIDTKVNNIKFFNRILSYLQLPLVPSSEPGMFSYIKRGLFFVRKVKTLGQNTIDKYVNKPIEQAFATGYLKINESGYLERNNEYNPILSMTNKLNSIINEEIGNNQEVEMLNTGSILSQLSDQNLNLTTVGQIGEYILKTGYIKLINGTLGDNTKGEFLSVKILIDKNGIIRYSESELVGLPENMQNETGRQGLTSSQLQQILSKEGYDIVSPEQMNKGELKTYRIRLQEDISSSQSPIVYGTVISAPKDVKSVIGIFGAEKTDGIFVDKFANPDNVGMAAQNKISLFTGGSYSSHAGIVLREYNKTSMIVNNSQITKQGIKIKFYQPKENVSKIGEISTQEIEEREISLQDKDIVVIDLSNNKLVLYPYSIFKNILFNLQKYIDEQNIEKIKEFIEKYKNNKLIDKIIEYIHYQSGDNEWLQDILAEYSTVYNTETDVNVSERPSRIINKIKITIDKYLPHNSSNNVYRFGEKESLDKTKVGTKSANQSKLFLIIEQLKKQTGISNVAVTNGVAIDYTILENLLGKEYIDLYNKLETVIQSDKDEKTKTEESEKILLQIRQLIININDNIIKDYIGNNNLKIFKNNSVIVRSSGVDEDGEDFSAAGIAESYGNINYENIPKAVKDVLSSFFSTRAFNYMIKSGKIIKPAVLIEDWIDADKAGIMMSEDTDGNRLVQVINGQGEDIVSGRISPYSFVVDIDTGEKIDGDYTNEKTITKETLDQLTKIMQYLEEVEGYPVDIEFLIKNNIIYIVQVRPITALGIYYEEDGVSDLKSEESVEIEEDDDISAFVQDLLSDEEKDTGYPKSKSKKAKSFKKGKSKKTKGKKNKSSTISRSTSNTNSSRVNNNDIRQPEGLTAEDVIKSCEKLAKSKDSFDSSLELTQQQIKDVLVREGLSRQQVEKIDFSKGLPDYIISLLKNKNSQVVGTTIDPRKTLFENLKEHPILFSLALETLKRVYESDFGPNSTLGDLLSFIEQRYSRNLYESTCTDLRGYFGEIYLINTLVAGIIPDKRAGPIIIRPELPTDNNIRGFDIYDINRVKIQVKTGGSEIVHHHFQRYWSPSLKDINQGGMVAIPVITTKNIKHNSFPRDNRVQGMDLTTETVVKFSHEFISALHGIAYKRSNPAIRNISLQSLIDSFKGFSTENPMTTEELIELLNKNQTDTSKKTKKVSKKQKNDRVIEFNPTRVNVDIIANQDVVVSLASGQSHVLYINSKQILVNEENKKEISKKDYSLYGIENVEYNKHGDITYVTFKDDVTLSNLTFDGEPEGSEENNVKFSKEEIYEMNLDTNTNGAVDVYLDDDVDIICHLIKEAAIKNKLIVFHFFKDNFKTSDLTPSQLLEIYKKITVLISNRFQISDIFPQTVDYSQYTDYGLDFFFKEILKNSLLRGNLGNVEEPIALHIKLDESRNVQSFSFYNKPTDMKIDKNKEVLATSAHLMINGDSRSTDIMNNNPVREYSFDEKHKVYKQKFRKAEVTLRSNIDMVLYRLEQEYKKADKGSIADIALQTETTVKNLFRIGFNKYKSQYLRETGKNEKDLTIEELIKLEEKTKDYRYTFSGLFHGVVLELFSLFSKNFIPSHRSMSPFKKIVVRTIRILSVGIGLSSAIISLSIIPLGIIEASIISLFFGFLSTIFSSAVLHFISNVIAVITKNYDFLLQQDIAIPTTTETTIYRGSELTEEDKERLESARRNRESFYDSIYIYQPNKSLQKDVEEIFKNLIDAMVTLGWITEEERDQYKLHYYYQPTANAFTIKNSKDVFIFSQLLYEIDKKFKKDGKALTKDIVAAIIAHELRHTIQENRNFEYKKRDRQFGVNKGEEKRKEYDADTGGLEILDMAGYNPKAMQELLSFFCEISEEGKYSLITLLDAHPNSKDRLKIVSSILESKDIAFMNMDKEEQPLSVKNIKNYFTFVASITKKIISFGYGNRIIRKNIINFMLSDKSNYFTNKEKSFLKQATNLQRNFIYELLFPQEKESKYYFINLSEKEKEELFDFVINTLNIYKIKHINSLFFGELIPNINMTKDRWEKLNEFKKINAITINMKLISDDAIWFYANNQEYLSDEELQGVTYRLGKDTEFFFENYNINTEQYMKILFGLLKTTKMYIFSQHTAKLLDKIEKAQYFSQQEKLEFIYLLYAPHHENGAIPRFLKLNKFPSVTESILNLFKIAETIDREEKNSYLWDYIIEEYGEGLSKCSLDELEKLSLATKSKEFDTFVLGWFIKSINPNFKIYFVSNYQESKNPQFFDGICLWPEMFSEGNNTENILKLVSTIDNSKIIENFKMLQNKMIETGIVNKDISFITYQILNNKGLLDEYKYDFKYLLCFLKNQDEIEIEVSNSTTYPIEFLKDIVEIQLPQASSFDLGSKYRFTKYFIHLAELYSFSIDYKKESFESAIELIKKHFNIAETFFKKNNEGEYDTDEQKKISTTEENLKNMEITRSFIYELHEIFNIEPISKTIKFKSGKDSYKYDYFEINKDLLDQVPTVQQVQELINLFAILKRELLKENVEIYAKIIYFLLKKNPSLSVFKSAEENIKLLDFLFEGFSKAKDDYINEILDKYDITPSQYKELKNKTTLVQYEQQTEDTNTAVAKEEVLYFTIEKITNQEDRINFLLWLMSSDQDSKYYRTYTLGNIKCKNNNDVVINFDSFRTEFQLMSKTERENVIRTIFLGSNGILNKKEYKEKNISEIINGLQNVLFNNLFFADEKVSSLNVAMANMFKKIFEIIFRNISDERKVIFVNNLFSALIDIKNETENSDMEEGALRARQLGRLIVAIGVNSGMAVLKLLQILSNNKVFEKLDDKYGYIINDEVSKVKSENEPLSKFVIFKYLERLGLLDKVEVVGKCLGSASIGLTYLIKFIGKKMFDVVKIKRPNIMKNYEEDFFVFSKIREYVISATSPLPEQYKKMIPKAEHLEKLFNEELNFGIESENLRDFSEQLKARNSEILVPQLINDGKYLFTQTSAKGDSLNNLELSVAERKGINFKILKEFFTEVFFDAQNSPTGQALYHADLHAGNIFIDENGNITFIDLGGVGKVDIEKSKSLKEIFIFLCLGNYNGFISSLKDFNRNIPKQLSSVNKSKIKEILERKVPLENKFADLFEIFNNLENMDKDFLMFMQSISKIAVYIDELELIGEDGKPNLKDILDYGKKLFNKNLSGVEKFVRENNEMLKKLAVSIYLKRYNSFINALSLYDKNITEKLSLNDKEQIKNILQSNISLQDKIENLIEIFNKLNIIDENLLLLLEIVNNIIYYIGEAELKDIIEKIFVSKIFAFSSRKRGEIKQPERTHTDIEMDSILEIVLSKCEHISNDQIKILENKLQSVSRDAIKICLKNSIVNLNLKQIIAFIDIANYLYEKGFITEKNEQDKINLLFKVVTKFDFKEEQIKELFEIDARFIDESLTIIEREKSKRKQKKLLKNFLKEKNKLDLEIMNVEVLKTILDFSDKNNSILAILPSDIAKKLLNDPKKLKLMMEFLNDGNDRELDLSLIVRLIDLPNEILEILSNNRDNKDSEYMFNLHKFCDLYEKCYDENKFYNVHKFVLALLKFTTVKYKDTSSRYYKFYNKVKNLGVIISWKIPIINKFIKFVNTHKNLTAKDKQIINIFKETVDIKTLEELSKNIYRFKLKTILKESQRINIPLNIDNDKFKNLLMCLENGIQITSELRTKIENTTDLNEFKQYADKLLSNKNKIMGKFEFLDRNAYIWEEIVFKVIPIVISAFNPIIGFYVFVSSQVFFILAHFIPKLLGGKNLNDAFVETKELIFSLPTLMSLCFTLLTLINLLIFELGSSIFQVIIPIILTGLSIPSIIIHRQYNEDHIQNPLSIVSNIVVTNNSSAIEKRIFAIKELTSILKPISLRKEIKNSELSQYFVSLAKKNGAKFISVYDIIPELNKLRKKDFKNNNGIEKYRSVRTSINPMHRVYFENKNKFVENSFGFALGLSYTHISRISERKVNLVQAISEKNNIISWERGYEYFYGPEYPATPPEDYMEKIKNMSLEYNKKIFFFLPRNIDSDDLSFKTRKELEYIQQHPEMLKNVVFVFGTYDCFNIESRESFNKYFNEEKIQSTMKRLLSHPEIYIYKPIDIIEKIRSMGLFKLFNNVFKSSFKKVIDLIAVLKNLEYSKKEVISENLKCVEQLKDDIINDNNKKVCFICTANINRSAVSHLLFEDKLLKNGIENISVVSAGFLPVSQKIAQKDLYLGEDYRKILDDFSVNQELIGNFRSEEFSDKHIDSDYFIVVSQKHKTLLIKKYNVDPEKIILYSDLEPELQVYSLPDPQKLKISKEGMVTLVNNIFNNTLFGFVLKQSSSWLKRILLNQNNNKIKTVIVNYKYIKSKEIEQILQMPIQEQNITDVYIIDDIEKLLDKYILDNTGIKIDGQSIFRIKIGNKLMYGARGISRIKIAKAINETEQIKNELRSILSIQENIEVEGIIRRNGDGIGINDGLLEIGEMDLFDKSTKEIEDYMLSALEVKNTIGLMYGQKTIIDLKRLSGQELLTALKNGKTRKVITEEQFNQLNLNKDTILDLRAKGIEIYIDTDKDGYKEYGISGQIIKEGEKKYIYDYYSEDKIELDVITKENGLANLEQKIINSPIPIMIDIELLKNSFQKKNSIEAFEMLSALLGKIKINMGLGNINKKDIESIGYTISFNKIPEMSLQEAKKLSQISDTYEMLKVIGENSEFGIILGNIKEKDIAESFIEIIKERVLAKSKLIETGNEIEGIELKDKKLEIMLGKLLLRAEKNNYKQLSKEEIENLMKDVKPINLIEELMKNIEELKVLDEQNNGKDVLEQELLVNKMILLILYSEKKNGKQLQKQVVVGDIAQYRAMLAAA